MSGLCSVCGETDPLPRHLCVFKLDAKARAQIAKEGRGCSYSVEGTKRSNERLAKLFATRAPIASDTESGT